VHEAGPRIFAAASGVSALQAAAGVRAILVISLIALRTVVTTSSNRAPSAILGHIKYEYALVVILSALLAIPLTPLRRAFALPPVALQSCDSAFVPVVARLGKESQYLTLVDDSSSLDALKGKFAFERLARRGIANTWFYDELAALPRPITVVHAWRLNGGSGPKEVNFYWPGDLSVYQYRTVLACVDEHQAVSIAQVPYWRARSVQPLE
jgi:hypothetical protein